MVGVLCKQRKNPRQGQKSLRNTIGSRLSLKGLVRKLVIIKRKSRIKNTQMKTNTQIILTLMRR
jgi:hypothetical protein